MKFETEKRRLVYENRWIRVYEDDIIRGGERGIYGVVERQDTVVSVPLSPSHRTVLLRQYRFPTKADSWELPMGGIEKGESVQNAARRELEEETGLAVGQGEVIANYRPVPGLSPQKVAVVVFAISDDALAGLDFPGQVDDIQSMRICTLENVLRMADVGDITDGFTISSLFFISRHVKGLRK